MKFSFLDVGFGYRSPQSEIDAVYQSVMDSGYCIGGGLVATFEAEFAKYCGAKYYVGMASGLDAIGVPIARPLCQWMPIRLP